ncbi:hypothetical protein T12_14058 [Trichinella patagoniensis]|uniref:Uncharacterized protein n=1 Tax=Trichinella patagoniensis TaxID=990121 RepID=A0A0V0ZZ74_9BILA|nr:hypothetical protein T12_14058 [Trichinella patagoniensis]
MSYSALNQESGINPSLVFGGYISLTGWGKFTTSRSGFSLKPAGISWRTLSGIRTSKRTNQKD